MYFILASQSPQRKRILQDMGIRFQAIPSHIEEEAGKLKRPHAIVKKIAFDKADHISKKYPDKWVIGCDTFVVLNNGMIALKPKNKEEAIGTLKKYQNSYCNVYSGLAMIHRKNKKKFIGYCKTKIVFKNFSDKSLDQYIKSNEWKDKSGSMTIEGAAKEWIKKIEGDYWNVVGLPNKLLTEWIKKIKH